MKPINAFTFRKTKIIIIITLDKNLVRQNSKDFYKNNIKITIICIVKKADLMVL